MDKYLRARLDKALRKQAEIQEDLDQLSQEYHQIGEKLDRLPRGAFDPRRWRALGEDIRRR